MTPRRASARSLHGFTLIELVVVIAVVGLLIGLLLPALAAARDAAVVSACAQRLRQLGVGLHVYANDHDGRLAVAEGVPPDPIFGYADETTATNALYLDAPDRLVGLGLLLNADYLQNEKALFSPGDDSTNPTEELAKIRTRAGSAACSYFFRQLDQTTGARVDDLGRNDAGRPATALALNVNALIPGAPVTCHGNRSVNMLYHDGRVETFDNSNNLTDGRFSIRATELFPPAVTAARFDAIFIDADAP